jgi:N-acetyl-beta-hexosaminidase
MKALFQVEWIMNHNKMESLIFMRAKATRAWSYKDADEQFNKERGISIDFNLYKLVSQNFWFHENHS